MWKYFSDRQNVPEAEPLEYCGKCGEPVILGDAYYVGGKRVVCETCVVDMNGQEAFEYLGYTRLTTAR